MGSQAMWRLAARGAEVIGYDRYAPGHDRGAAGGESRIFRAAHLGEPGYIPLLRLADGLWEQLQAETGRSLRRRSGCLRDGRDRLTGHAPPPLLQRHPSSGSRGAGPGTPSPVATRSTVSRTDTPPYSTGWAPSSGPRRRSRRPPHRAEQLGARLHRYTPVREVVPAAGGGVADRHRPRHGPRGRRRGDRGPLDQHTAPGPPRTVDVRRVICSWHLPTRHDWFGGRGAPPSCAPHPTTASGSRRPTACPSSSVSPFARHLPVPEPERLDRTVRPEELGTFRELISELMPDLNPDPIRMSAYMEGYAESVRKPARRSISRGEDDIIVHGRILRQRLQDLARDGRGSPPTWRSTAPLDHPVDFLAPAGVGAA